MDYISNINSLHENREWKTKDIGRGGRKKILSGRGVGPKDLIVW